MPERPKRDPPKLFDGRFAEDRVASASIHIDAIRALLDRRPHPERTEAADRPPGATQRRETD